MIAPIKLRDSAAKPSMLQRTQFTAMAEKPIPKGRVRRTMKDRAYFYKPVVSRSHVTGEHISDIVDRLFGGSAESLVMSLVETKQLTPKALARLQKLLEEDAKK